MTSLLGPQLSFRPDTSVKSTRSLRDPAGVLVFVDGTPVRLIRDAAADPLWAFLSSSHAARLFERGAIVATERLSADALLRLARNSDFGALLAAERWAGAVQHERIPFASFPEEWTPGLLYAAAHHTLDLSEELLAHGRGLKDATPYNILFRGTTPVFVDLLSIEQRDAGDPVWLPYAQFVRTFLIPLLVWKRNRRSLRAVFGSHADGMEPEEALRALSALNRVRPPAPSLVTLPTMMSKLFGNAPAAAPSPRCAPDRAAFILRSLMKHLRRRLRSLEPEPRPASRWTDYAESEHTAAYMQAKQALVRKVVEAGGAMALDIGANTGDLAGVAARRGLSVVAIDSDVEAVERMVTRARREALDILPLVVDVADPTPARGWANEERPSFLERGGQSFDVVIAMSVVHHLVVRSGIPVDAIVDMLAHFSRDRVVVEFVPPTDPHFRRLARGRDALHAGLTLDSFVHAVERRFRIVERVPMPIEGRIGFILQRS